MIINHNISALNAWRQLSITDANLSKSLEKLSSGFRINRAADDAAGLAISERMRAQIGGLNTATRNAQDGISMIQTAEGAQSEVSSILNRLRDLSTQAASETLTDTDRAQIQKEVTQLVAEIDHIANKTTFNSKNLLDGSLATTGIKVQIGITASDTLEVKIANMQSVALGASTTGVTTVTNVSLLNVTTTTLANESIQVVDQAINDVAASRATLGSYQNRLEHTVANLQTTAENLTAAESRIRDVDMALEMANFTKNQILMQAGTAMLAQANTKPQSVLQLLR